MRESHFVLFMASHQIELIVKMKFTFLRMHIDFIVREDPSSIYSVSDIISP